MKTMKEYLSSAEGVRQMWDKINEVLDNFDFNTVAAVMETLDWSWHCTKEEAEDYDAAGCKVKWNDEYDLGGCEFYPEYPQLLAKARGLLAQAYIYNVDQGEEDDFKHSVVLSLYFIVEEYETD